MTTGTTVTGSKLRLNAYLMNNNIEGFAIKNFRERFLIPSNHNIFGGVQIEYVFPGRSKRSRL